MARILVIADDLTGANGTASVFVGAGYRAITTAIHQLAQIPPGYDVLVTSTNSRHLDPDTARELIAEAITLAGPVDLICNRIDTTMRGNIGATTAAVRTIAQAKSGQRTVCVMAPAWPQAGRVTVEGHQLFHGRRLEYTDVAMDVRTPITRSDLAGILGLQADLRTAHIPLSLITLEDDSLRHTIADHLRAGVEALIVDAITPDHLEWAMQACVEASTLVDEPIRWVTSDPGPGSVAMANALGLLAPASHLPTVVVCGSASALTMTQLNRLQQDRNAWLIKPPTLADGWTLDVSAGITALGQLIDDALPGQVVGLATAFTQDDIRPLPAGVQEVPLTLALAEILEGTITDHPIGGLYLSGGDVTGAVLDQLGIRGFAIDGEVEPLSVAGRLIGGPIPGLPTVTKGGLVGDDQSLIRAIDYVHQYKPAGSSV